MEHYWHVILEALIDTAKILPFLFITYYLIELLEFKYAIQFQNNKWLKGGASPVIGTLIGCVPQCGFSVVSTDLYSKGAISIGALIGVYIATSDEAIPLLISNTKSIPWLVALVLIKIVFGIIIGYLAIGLHKLIFKHKKANLEHVEQENEEDHDYEEDHEHEEDHKHEDHEHNGTDHEIKEIGKGCCHHHVRSKSFDWLHPMMHCLKISAFVLVVNILFGCITHIWIGEAALTQFMNKSFWLQPILAAVIGIIPNCASSVALAELFMLGGLSFGALTTGLCINAGLGLIILLKQNKNWKENLFIILLLVIPSIILGYLINIVQVLI